MRQIWAKVPEGKGGDIYQLAKKHDGINLLQWSVQNEDKNYDVIVMNVSNKKVSEVLKDIEKFDQAEITLYPQDIYPLFPPSSEVPDQITHVTQRSPIEVWLNGLQSIGSWKGFLGYAVAASVIVWIGMLTNTSYLLVAAMLVAPFASPAMNFAMATATGDPTLLWRNLLRYFISLTLTITVCALLSLVFQQRVVSNTMVQVSAISTVAFLLPLAAGAVGAHNLSQSSNQSFVPGAVTGALIAASLAPPAGLIGMAAALGRWDLAVNGAFLLVLQLVGINLSGSLIFRYYNLSPSGTRFERGKPHYFHVSIGVSLVLLAGILLWQFSNSPELQRSTRAQRATSVAQQVIRDYPYAQPVEVNMRFTRPSPQEGNVLLGIIYVQPEPGTEVTDEQIREDLFQLVNQAVLDNFNVKPLLSVTVVRPPDQE